MKESKILVKINKVHECKLMVYIRACNCIKKKLL